jgi:hypothetical protein
MKTFKKDYDPIPETDVSEEKKSDVRPLQKNSNFIQSKRYSKSLKYSKNEVVLKIKAP